MIHNYNQCRKYKLTPTGYTIMFSATEEFQRLHSHLFKLLEGEVIHDLHYRCTHVRGVFAMDNKGAASHCAVLSWQHQILNDGSSTPFLYPFTFRCEIHLHLCESMKCSCVCINLVLVHLRRTKLESTFHYLPFHVQTEIRQNKKIV